MGTNYYLTENCCPHCKRGDARLHIGKSSAGWCFSLHIDPELGIANLGDWKERWSAHDAEIYNEYGDRIEPEEMERIITARGREPKCSAPPFGYPSWEVFHKMNESEQGPAGLLRHRVNRFCVGHGDGTYDLVVGEYS